MIEKVTLNAETQGNPDAILNVLHEANLKEEALSIDNNRALVIKKDNFPSKIIHYCSNGKHNALVTTHGPEKCWQLHPELKPERQQKDKEKKVNFTIARALFTHESRKRDTSITIVLDTGASNHMFNDKSFFEKLYTNHHAKVTTGCGKSTVISQGKGLAKIVDRLVPKHDNQSTPYEIWHGSKPPLHRLKPFGCKAWVKISTHSIKNKFDSKAWDFIFLGYEKKFPSLPAQKHLTEDIVRTLSNPIQVTEEETQVDSNMEEILSSIDTNYVNNEEEEIYFDALEQKPKRIRLIGPRHPTLISREIHNNNILPFSRRHTRENLTNITQIPRTFNDAMANPNKENWNIAIKKGTSKHGKPKRLDS
ncbi:hypothetical protein O181_004684 [Austropuccinia psidii MF-1]|uniref:Uncharacterized protein n=1 Tax=Austropuccinia psidii MF-1 TaxID=1389203 RepID=A0A9Q3BG91_9BASI|nr:hypothetical protein [Austropuccinia psidii MF-1]